MDTRFHVEGVSLALGGAPILRDLSLELDTHGDRGRIVALLGPSGMGKTQLFRVLAGIQPPDLGRVDRAEVGVLAQDYPLFEHRTVMGNLLVARPDHRLASKLLARFGLEGLAERYPAQLSGGQRQRAAIAQQFMREPKVLLMDEPFSGQDPLAVARLCALVREVAAHGTAVLLVTHDIAAALDVADELWLLGRDRDANGEPRPGARIQARIPKCEASAHDLRARFETL